MVCFTSYTNCFFEIPPVFVLLFNMKAVRILSLFFFLKKGLKKNYFPNLKSLILIDSLWNIPVIWYPENGYMVHICSGVQNFVYCEKLLFFWIGVSFLLSNLHVWFHLDSRLERESERWWSGFCFVLREFLLHSICNLFCLGCQLWLKVGSPITCI